MSSGAAVAVFVSPHGFGHAARAAAVMAAVTRRRPETRFEVFTTVPEWFFAESGVGTFGYHSLATDVGLVQHTALAEDLAATAHRLEEFLPWAEGLLDRLADQVRRRDCRTVVCDIAPLGLAAAARVGVPAVLVENFTWDWIYSQYDTAPPALGRHAAALSRMFELADLHIQATPACQPRSTARWVAPISRRPRSTREATRARLAVPEDAPLVLVTMGGVPWRFASLDRLANHQHAFFAVPGGSESITHRGHLRALPHHSELYHPDLVWAADAVVGKLGYSTLAETYHAGAAFAFIARSRFPESGSLAEFARVHMPAVEIPEASLTECGWLDRLDELLALPRPTSARVNGDDEAAELIVRFAGI